MGDNFPWKAKLQKIQPLPKQEHLQEEKPRQDSIIPTYGFGMGNFKGEGRNMIGALHCRVVALSLWSKDPFWRSQLLVEYSKDLFSCRILDDQLSNSTDAVRDGVICF